MNIIKVFKREIEKLNPSDSKKRKVKIRTKEKCPKCGGKFEEIPGVAFLCLKCKTTPKRYFIDLTWQKKRIRIYSDKSGQPLSSYEQARRLASHIQYEIDHHIFDPSLYVASDLEKFRIEYLVKKYLSEKEKQLKYSAFRKKKLWLNKAMEALLSQGVTDVREIRGIHLNDFINSLYSQNLAPKTIKNIRTEIAAFLNWCHKLGIIKELPYIPEVKVPEPAIQWISKEDQEKILSAIPEEHRDIFVFILTYGLRPSEARALKWDCVFFKDELFVIKRNFSDGKLYEITKENKWKALPMIGPIKKMLLKRAKNKQSEFVFWYKSSTGNFYPYYGETKLRRIWKKACKKTGIHISLYAGSRHSKAMQLLQQGASYEQIGALLGYSSPQTTRRYARLKAEQVRSLLEKCSNIIPFPVSNIKENRS